MRRASRRSLPMPANAPRGKLAHGVIVFCTWRSRNPDSAPWNHRICSRQRRDSLSNCLGCQMEGLSVQRPANGSFRLWDSCGKSVPLLLRMDRSPRCAFPKDFLQTYNDFAPVHCLGFQLPMQRWTGFRLPHSEKADVAGQSGTGNCNGVVAYSRHIHGRKRSPHGVAAAPQKT